MGNFYEDLQKYRKELLLFGFAMILFLLIKYLVVYVLPFIFAGIFVFIIRRPVDFIHKRTKIGKGFLAGLFLSVLCLILGTGIWYVSCHILAKLRFLVSDLNFFERQLFGFVHNCCDAVETNLGMNSLTIENLILERVDIFIDDLKIDVVPKLLDQSFTYGRVIFRGIMFIVVTLISVVLLAKDYDRILEKAAEIKAFREGMLILKKLGAFICGYVRAQLEIILVISILSGIGFGLSGCPYPFILGVLTGLLDVLPFIGTGVTLLPTALLQLLMGNGMHAVILTITFIICALARELLEPKLIGARMGVIPIAILFSVYVGAKVFGAAGVIWGPLYMLIVFELYKSLFKKEA